MRHIRFGAQRGSVQEGARNNFADMSHELGLVFTRGGPWHGAHDVNRLMTYGLFRTIE